MGVVVGCCFLIWGWVGGGMFGGGDLLHVVLLLFCFCLFYFYFLFFIFCGEGGCPQVPYTDKVTT